MKRVLLAGIAWVVLGNVLSAEGKSLFQYDDRRFELPYAYAFRLNAAGGPAIPDPGAPPGAEWKENLALALSDQPFDTTAMRGGDPLAALARMGLSGALVITVVPGDSGKVALVRIGLPKSDRLIQPDPSTATLQMEPNPAGKIRGRLLIWASESKKPRAKKGPLMAADVPFETAVPARP